MLFCMSFIPVFTANVSAKNTNNFYFEDANFSYYLSKNDDGTSNLHVEETLTAIFPDTDQNHGITRSIPYTNQGGENITAESKNALNFKVMRNGVAEEISKTETSDGAYVFYIGNKNTYVHGRQVYTLSYDFNNVITEFDSNGNLTYNGNNAVFQELYWDTNGTGWSQQFMKLTASLFLPEDMEDKVLTDKTSCYVGRYGEKGSSRCNISTYKNVITFTANTIAAGENLTFVVDFEPDTFVVKTPARSPLLLIIAVLSVLAGLLVIAYAIHKYNLQNKEKKSYYKGLFVAPQYQPYKDVTVAEAEKICLHSVKSSKVATILELAVNKKIQIIQTEKSGIIGKKNQWQIKVLSTDGLSQPQTIILKILNGGTMPAKGETFEVKTQKYSYSLAALNRSYPTTSDSLLTAKHYLESNPPKNTYTALPILYFFLHLFVISFALVALLGPFKKYLFGEICFGGMFALDFAGIFISSIMTAKLKNYAKYTTSGLDLANYYEGLKLYITMAEKDRLKFLQSVKGADKSEKGIVKLYEKLLPYACLFGVEKSWMDELNKYYEKLDYDPYWYDGNARFTGYMLGSMISNTNSSISSGTMSSSSSSSSGGGGGGFSGGGGGGGGGGGW